MVYASTEKGKEGRTIEDGGLDFGGSAGREFASVRERRLVSKKTEGPRGGHRIGEGVRFEKLVGKKRESREHFGGPPEGGLRAIVFQDKNESGRRRPGKRWKGKNECEGVSLQSRGRVSGGGGGLRQ